MLACVLAVPVSLQSVVKIGDCQ